MAKQVIERSAHLGIGDKVLFTGFLREKELARLYGCADLLVMPSVSEPFGIVPLEALLNNTPVLISKQSGVAEVLRNALKTDFWDVEEMANKIISVLDNPSLRDTLKYEGTREARAQIWKKAARRCMMIYDKVARVAKSLSHV
jgi:glycosyltransferase involved in cell wall biosynthesis